MPMTSEKISMDVLSLSKPTWDTPVCFPLGEPLSIHIGPYDR